MQVKKEQLTPTSTKLTITADPAELAVVKQHVLKDLSKSVKVQGFREGKAPAHLIEKQVDQNVLQSEFLDHVVNERYVDAIQQEQLRPAGQPQITVTKFVPFSEVEFTAEVEVVGDVTLADYTKVKLDQTPVSVSAKDVDEVLDNLRTRAATKQDVTRAAKDGDEVTIDFTGTDAKTQEPIDGADGSDYPLTIGSKTFIPGFEEELIGLKPGDEKTFVITFPKDYGTASLQSRKVQFVVTVKKVTELAKPELDDAFAASVGPFKTVAELKADIKKQLKVEREQEAQRAYDNQLIQNIAEKSEVAIPTALIDEEVERIEEEEKRNSAYRGQTWQEHLDAEGVTAEEHKEKNRPGAELRVKAGLVLSEIADKEKLTVTPEELEIRIQLLKGQYPDPAMQAELDKPENRRDILSRMLTEKTLDKLRGYATAK
ncbi:MAG: Trigger factor [Candidatus Saccharibacteria bacterium]|nr:Trigger factor [Candidatus Saccharibacteria bacterium]